MNLVLRKVEVNLVELGGCTHHALSNYLLKFPHISALIMVVRLPMAERKQSVQMKSLRAGTSPISTVACVMRHACEVLPEIENVEIKSQSRIPSCIALVRDTSYFMS